VTILDSLREMLVLAHEAEGLPAEVEIRLPLRVLRVLLRDAMKTREDGVVWRDGGDAESTWIRSFEEWGAIYICPLETK
jgi:hypothetical protein